MTEKTQEVIKPSRQPINKGAQIEYKTNNTGGRMKNRTINVKGAEVKHRAGYGARVLAELSLRLTAALGRGYSVDSLKAFRQFYMDYPLLISETASRKLVAPFVDSNNSDTLSRNSAAVDWKPGVLHANLSWSHYRHLLRAGRGHAMASLPPPHNGILPERYIA